MKNKLTTFTLMIYLLTSFLYAQEANKKTITTVPMFSTNNELTISNIIK